MPALPCVLVRVALLQLLCVWDLHPYPNLKQCTAHERSVSVWLIPNGHWAVDHMTAGLHPSVRAAWRATCSSAPITGKYSRMVEVHAPRRGGGLAGSAAHEAVPHSSCLVGHSGSGGQPGLLSCMFAQHASLREPKILPQISSRAYAGGALMAQGRAPRFHR